MPRIRDMLRRFRPTGVPGAAAGVPADRAAELAAELAPQLDRLTQTQAEAARIRESADREAEAVRREAARQAAVTVSEARTRAVGVRTEAAEQAGRVGESEAAEILAAGDRAVALLGVRIEQRMPALVDEATARLLTELGTRPAQREGRARWAPDGSQA